MPLVEDYRPALDSEVADISPRLPRPLDLGRVDHRGAVPAGVRRRPAAGRTSTSPGRPARTATEHEVTKGATGFGARLLLRWLETLADLPLERLCRVTRFAATVAVMHAGSTVARD